MTSKVRDKQARSTFLGFSPWLLIGISIVMGLVIVVLAIKNTEKERQFVSQSLLDRANALIWALEAGTRTWMGFQGESRLLQSLVEETIKQPGIAYLAVTDKSGNIIAYSSTANMSARAVEAMPQPPAGDSLRWRLKSEDAVFEVYRLFQPLVTYDSHQRGGGHHGGMGGGNMGHGMGWRGGQNLLDGAVVFVGLDHAPLEQALAEDFRNNVITALILGVSGLAGFLCLFWAHNYQRSRRLLKDTQALASEVVTSLPVGLITSDPADNVGMINAVALDMLNISAQQARGAPLRAIKALDWESIIAALKGGQKVLERDVTLKREQDAPMPVSLSASRIYDEDGLFLGHLFIMRDVTQVKRLQDEVRRNERLSALGHLAAGVAHEIRNPLSSIKGLATYIAGKSQAGISDAAKTMISEVNRLNTVVSELLEFARPASVKLSRQDVNQAVARALRLAEADISSKRINVEFVQDKSAPLAMVNQEKLTQALLNLFLNAIQAMDEGGQLLVSAKAENNHVNISISDNGSGMDQKLQASIFTPYFTTRPGGTGLGLAIVHQIVEAHNGAISLKSSPGAGSTFTITLNAE